MQALISKALASGGHAAADMSYIAVHGTGTPLGDPIEVGALAAALTSADSAAACIGSVKVCCLLFSCTFFGELSHKLIRISHRDNLTEQIRDSMKLADEYKSSCPLRYICGTTRNATLG